ncbi:MAG: glycosyltransferase family 2 protein [Anaerolineae bacterium]|nr:glycosyltransferase family 2 protein [Anaerolineae bacterium]
MPKIVVVVVNWRAWPSTQRCVAALRASSLQPDDIFIVNNDSTDGPLPNLSATIIHSHTNLGYAAGMNLGVAQAISCGADYVLALNNDAEVAPTAIEQLLHSALKQDTALTGGRIVSPVSGKTEWLSAQWPQYLFKGRQYDNVPPKRLLLSGAAMFMRRDLLQQRITLHGWVFDPSFFMYQEDIDLCLFAHKHGFTCAVAPQAIIYHQAASNFGGAFNPRTQYYTARNRVSIANRWLPFSLKVLFHMYYLPAQLILRGVNRGKWRQAARLATLHGIADGYRGVTGMCQRYHS